MFLERIAETVLRQTVLIPNIFVSRSGEKLLGVIRRCRRQEEISYWTQKFSNITHQIRNGFLPEKKKKVICKYKVPKERLMQKSHKQKYQPSV